MAAGDTTPKLIRHTLYTHSTSLQDIFSLRYTYVLEVYSEAMYNLFQAFYRDCKIKTVALISFSKGFIK